MRIGELARRAGVTTSRIRFYEARGLLPPALRRPSGYRDYDEEAVVVLMFIARARSLGFSLAEIAVHLGSPRDSGRKIRLLRLMQRKVEELDLRLTAMAKQRETLAGIIGELRELL